MTKAEKQVLKRVYLEHKEVKVYYWNLAKALEDKYPVRDAGGPEQKEINEYYKLTEDWSAKENVIKDLVKELTKGQKINEYLDVTVLDLADLIEHVDRQVDHYIKG